MQIGFKFYGCRGFGTLYNYGLKHNPNHTMITKEAEQRVKILKFWRQYGLKATQSAFGARRSTLYGWWRIYQRLGYRTDSLNPKSQAPKNKRKRQINPRIINEIRRLRFEVCLNMGKAKIKPELDDFCGNSQLPAISIGRVMAGLAVDNPGDLIELDTVVKFACGIKYIITAVDIKTRYSFALAYAKHDSASAKDFFKKLEQAFPYAIRAAQTDNGSEFHRYFRDYLKQGKIKHYWNYPGKPYRNGHIEKYNRTIQEEFVDWHEVLLENLGRFNQKLVDWLLWYNTKRRHWGLNLISPVDYLIKNNFVSRMCWTTSYIQHSSATR